MREIDTGQHPATHASVCDQLYLIPNNRTRNTAPHVSSATRAPSQPSPHAVHVPLVPTNAHQHLTWTLWTGLNTQHEHHELTDHQRRQRQGKTEAFATSKTDPVLDEYIKTRAPTLAAETVVSYATTKVSERQSLHKSKQWLHTKRHAPEQKEHAPHTRTSNPPPPGVRSQASLSRRCIVETQQHATMTKGWTHAPLSAKTCTTTHAAPHPLRLHSAQKHPHRRSTPLLMTPTASNPLHLATVVTEALETYLESKCIPELRSTDYKTHARNIRLLVRRIILRGGIVEEWLESLATNKIDLVDTLPTMDSFARRYAYAYMTPRRLSSTLMAHAGFLGTNAVEWHMLMLLVDTVDIKWWRGANNAHAQPSLPINLQWMLLLNAQYDESHSSETARHEIVREVLPPSTDNATLQQYANRYEQLVRIHSMSEPAFRKDNSTLSAMYGVVNFARATATKSAPTTSARRTRTTKLVRKASDRMKTVSLSLNAKDRVPQAINVKRTQHTTSATTKKKRAMTTATPTATPTATTTETPTATPTHPKRSQQNAHNAQKRSTTPTKGKVNAKTNGGAVLTKTLTIDTSVNSPDTLVKTPRVVNSVTSKEKTSAPQRGGGTRYLTEEEVATYKHGLQTHIKGKGGMAFVQEQQKSQNKKIPAFHFDNIVTTTHKDYAEIQRKLQLSAKNRNALRRVKRDVLKSFGGHRTFKNQRKVKKQDGSSVHFTGSLYTQKNAGGKAKSTTPNTLRVTWKESDSLGGTLRDESANDGSATEGLSSVDLSGLEEVHITF